MGSRLRAKVATNLSKVVSGGHSLSEILLSFNSIEQNDQPLAREMISGSLRQYFRLNNITQELLSKPMKNKDSDIHCLIIIGLYQLYFMRIPDHAVVSETVQATIKMKKKWAKSLVNAVLRKAQRQREQFLKLSKSDPALESSFPNWLYERLKNDWPTTINMITSGCHKKAPLTLRINTTKTDVDNYQKMLQDENIQSTCHPLSEVALILDKGHPVQSLPGYQQGLFSVQDVAAQLISPLLDPKTDEVILDACAAPGGKSSHIQELTNNSSQLFALDQSETRLARLTENLARLGLSVTTKKGDASAPKEWNQATQYDKILCDVPCSATGIIRKHPDILVLRRKSDMKNLVKIQSQILDELWKLLKPNGILVYSTCSILKEENSTQVHKFLDRTPNAQIQLNYPFDQTELEKNKEFQAERLKIEQYGFQIFPSELSMDGFFMAKIKKISETDTN